ncbi:hypothetical protein [Sphingomonas montana]|uniref:hypothetical protein n=1 Tax=Sphingomonas montana TaxID=1843236 RepID=UPI00096E3F54|nr:hypothetical protein [Sphingomonas montana]
MTRLVEILVSLLNEGTDVCRPVKAEWLGGDRYRVLSDAPPDEEWAFRSGTIVIARKVEGGIRAVDEEGGDEEFWAEHDPYGDRFGTPIGKWGCAVALAVGMIGFYAVYRFLISIGFAAQIRF